MSLEDETWSSDDRRHWSEETYRDVQSRLRVKNLLSLLIVFFDNEVSHDRRDSEKFFDNFHDQDLNHVYDAVSIGRRQVVEDVEEEIHLLTTHNLIFYIFDRDV